MRLIINFKPVYYRNNVNINNFEVQGLIYNLLKYTRYEYLHDIRGFKFFCFSNVFYTHGVYHLIISSPISNLIKTLYYKLKTLDTIKFGRNLYNIESVKKINNYIPNNYFKNSTPIILFHNQTRSNHCYSFKNDDINYNWFFNRLKENALKKYNAFYDDEYYFEEPLFDSYQFKKEVAVHSKKNNQRLIFIGSLWEKLNVKLNSKNYKFYKFLFDTGLGEKNSAGFGMIQ